MFCILRFLTIYLLFLSAVLILQINECCKAQQLPGLSDPWQSKLSKDREYDFGVVPVGKRPSHKFEIANPFDKPLVVSAVSASCGCSSAYVMPKEIKPGETAHLNVQLNTKAFRGKKSSSIQVQFKDVGKELSFSITATIEPLSISPKVINLEYRPKVASEATVVVSRSGSPYWKIKNLRTSSKAIEATVADKKVSPDSVVYSIKCAYTNTASGRHSSQEYIYAETNDSAAPKLAIPVRLFKASDSLAVTSREVILAAPAWTKKTIIHSKEPVTLLEARSDSEDIKIQFARDGKPRKVHVVQVSYVGDPATFAKNRHVSNPISIEVQASNEESCEFFVSITPTGEGTSIVSGFKKSKE